MLGSDARCFPSMEPLVLFQIVFDGHATILGMLSDFILVDQTKLSEVVTVGQNCLNYGEVSLLFGGFLNSYSTFQNYVHFVSDVSLLEDGCPCGDTQVLGLLKNHFPLIVIESLEELEVLEH